MIRLLVAGDMCQTGRVSLLSDKQQFDDAFKEIKSITDNQDFNIVNLESPIVSGYSEKINKGGPTLKCDPRIVDAIKCVGFNICTLANNHILDYGEDSCLTTKSIIEKSGLKSVGAGKNLYDASETLFLNQNNEIIAIINCCEHEFSIASNSSAGANPLNPISQYYKIKKAQERANYILIIVHGGHEMCQLPSPRMKETYRFFIDAGADAVVNHHQHCYSGYEEYKGKPIFYGLGNFFFDRDGKRKSVWNEGYMVGLKFEDKKKTEYEIYPYSQCDEEPVVKLLKGAKYNSFEKSIDNLNRIISDDQRLRTEWENWIKSNSGYFLIDYQPYNTRITKGLFVRGFLPSFISRKKKYSILNHIECESHLDRLKILIRNLKD